MEWGIKNSPELVKAGSLALHPSWEEKRSLKKSREIYQFTNLQIYKHKNLGLNINSAAGLSRNLD
jgi:hypothetical protein